MSAYFEALAEQDLDAIAAAWAPDGVLRTVGDVEAGGPDGVRAYWAEFFGAMPDFRFEVAGHRRRRRPGRRPLGGQGHVRGPASFQGIEPTFARLDLVGLDIFDLRDGKIVREHAYTDGADASRARSGCCRRRARPPSSA